MKNILTLILLFTIVIGIRAQGYVPKVGETILFYPLTKKAKQKHLGYDCFYDTHKVISKGKYKFKKGYQYKCDKNGLTPFSEIEGKTFKVLNYEDYMHKENKNFLLFLSCIEDNSEVILRIPFYEKNTSGLTTKMICEKYEGYHSKKRFANLPCLPVQYITQIKNKFQNEELLHKETVINHARGRTDFEEQTTRDKMFYSISMAANPKILGDFSWHMIETCIDVRFEECEISHYTHPFAICTYRKEDIIDTIRIPLTYIVEETPYYFNAYASSNLLFENYFVLKKEEVKNIFAREKCFPMIEKYTGKDVYYGLNNRYFYSGDNLNSKNNINIDNGTNYGVIVGNIYKCLKFDVFWSGYGSQYDVYAVLQDSSGTKFRVPAKRKFSGIKGSAKSIHSGNHYSKDFSDYFTLLNEALSQIERQKHLAIKKEKEEKEQYASWVKKYGASYAKYINELSELKREKFERLVSKYGKATAKMMVEGKVKLGWNKQMCKESWGEPDDINRTTGSWGTHEQWVYGEIYCDYLYFENGILTSIQN